MAMSTAADVNWARVLPRKSFLSSAGRKWRHLQVARFQHPENWRLELPPLSTHYIGVHMSGPSLVLERWLGPTRRRVWTPGEVMLMSADQASSWEWKQPFDELHIYLAPESLAAAAAELTDRPVRLLDGVGMIDPVIGQLALAICNELARPDSTALMDEHFAMSLIARLLQHYSNLRSTRALDRFDISTHRLRAVLEYIDTHLGQDLKLEDIAAVASMSPFHFARGFRKAMGLPPHRYLTARRIDRARNLLARKSDDVEAIAREVGFQSHSHFSSVFKSCSGVTPTQYRASVTVKRMISLGDDTRRPA
jgi:AraC family transcriptional regulator